MRTHPLPLYFLLLLPVAPLTATPLGAQQPVRPVTQLSSGSVTTSVHGYDSWRIAAPKRDLPADPGRGLARTARVAYAVWPDQDPAGNGTLRFLKSDDGGWSWDTTRAVTIWTNDVAAGETFTLGKALSLHADGHEVFVVLTSSRTGSGQADPAGRQRVWVAGSPDQGQTWSTAMVSTGCDSNLPTGDLLADAGNPRAATGNGLLHVVFEAGYQHAVGIAGATGNQDVYFNSVGFFGGPLQRVHTPELRVDVGSGPSGEVDSDSAEVDADGSTVAVVWQDDRIVSANGGGGNNAANNTYVKVSQNAGTDLGNLPETDLTGFTSTIGYSARRSQVAVRGSAVYVACEDSRNLVDDDIYLNVSLDQGRSWTTGIVASRSPSLVDSDGMLLLVDDRQNLAIAYRDDRQGPGNVDNDIFVVSGTLADFQAGTQVETLVFDSPASDTVLYAADQAGDVFAFACELSAFPEDSGVIFSADRGRTWQVAYNVRNQVADTDDVDVAVTLNGDIVPIWQDDQNNGNGANNVYVRGLKVPLLEDLTANGQGLRLSLAGAGKAGDLAVLFPSFTAPVSNGFALHPLNGPILNFAFDGLTVAATGNLLAFVATVDGNGVARWRYPNFATLVQQPIHYVVQLVDAPTGALGAFSDPLRQDP